MDLKTFEEMYKQINRRKIKSVCFHQSTAAMENLEITF